MSLASVPITDCAQNEATYRSIVEHAIEGIFQTTPDGRYLLANPALAAIYEKYGEGFSTPDLADARALLGILTHRDKAS